MLMPESVAEALHLSIEEVTLSLGPRGFYRKFLEEKARALEKEGLVYSTKEEVDALKAIIALLTKENEELQSKLHALDKYHAKLKRKSEEDIELLTEIIKKDKIEENLKDKYQDGLAQANIGLTSLKKQLKQTKKEPGDNHRWFELDVKEKKVLRDESYLEIHKLKLSLREANAKVEVERRLKEEAIRVSYITPQVWKEKFHKDELATLSAEHWRDHLSALKNESLGWLNEKARMNSLLDAYVGSINLLQTAAIMYRTKYGCLVRFCNELTKEVPWKIENSLEDVDENTTSYFIL
ncbi:uncharacterized protein LOC127103035 [Lathyrus oleraceus]|uniref:uncharacterized protein LOC127103035 n=1 Tax=Pisum sativum TaxID=3888 RepID=UPI0021D2C212|nr:uncharacterized protein LOC127103035 [Pisum sativum]